MSETPKRRVKQTAAAKKARSESAKRAAATRKANQQVTAKTVAQQEAKVSTVNMLKQRDLPVPPDLAAEVEHMDVSGLKDKIDEEPFKDSIDTPASSPVHAKEKAAKEALRVLALSAENERLRDRLAVLEAEKLDLESPVENLFENVHYAEKEHPSVAEIVAKDKEFEPPRPVQVARVVRNLRSAVIHLTLAAPNSEKAFRLNLRPRGERGDAQAVPYGYQHDPQFQGSVGVLFEIITQTEAKQLAYGPAGYNPQHREGVQIIRDADTVKTVGRVDVGGEKGTRVSMTRAHEQGIPGQIEEPQFTEAEWLERQQKWAAEQRAQAQAEKAEVANDRPHGANPTFANVPGADTGLQNGLNAASAATTVTREESFNEEEIGADKVARELSEEQRRMIAMVEQAERAERAKISKLERDGILPPGALNQKVTITRSAG